MDRLLVLLPLGAAFATQAAACWWMTKRFLGYLYARSNITAAPDLLGPVSGTLQSDAIELDYPHARSTLPLGSISDVRLAPDGAGLIIDHDRKSLTVLPRHLFEEREFVQACERLVPSSHDSRRLSGSDPPQRTLEPLNLVSKPADASAFSGGVIVSECEWTPLYREQAARIYGFYGCLFLNAVTFSLSIAYFVHGGMRVGHVTFLLTSLVVLFFLVRLTTAFWRLWSMKSSGITHVSGWLSSDGLTVISAVGSTTYRLEFFERVELSARSVQLVSPGHYQQTIVLSKPMFESAEGFRRLCRWAREPTP